MKGEEGKASDLRTQWDILSSCPAWRSSSPGLSVCGRASELTHPIKTEAAQTFSRPTVNVWECPNPSYKY